MDIKKDVVDANRGGLPKRAYFGRQNVCLQFRFPAVAIKQTCVKSIGRPWVGRIQLQTVLVEHRIIYEGISWKGYSALVMIQ